MSKLFIFLLLLVFFFPSCEEIDFYEKTTVIKDHEWKRSDTVNGQFLISDTTCDYDILLVLRHTDAYDYNNIWIEIGFKGPSDSSSVQRLDIPLGSDATGWEGSGMNDIWEVRKKLTPLPRKFRYAGAYRYQIRQVMRDNPLKHIMSVGLRVQATR